MSHSAPQILYVDSESACCTLAGLLLASSGQSEVTTADSAEEALQLMSARSFDLYIFDEPWRDRSALELCRRVRQKDRKAPILIFSVLQSEMDRDRAFKAGASEYLIKPDDVNRLAEVAERLLNGFTG